MRAGIAAVLNAVHGQPVILEEVSAEASIRDLLAEVTVTQRYRNPEKTNIEAVYTFPLPLDGVLLSFEVEIDHRKLRGTVVEKSELERHYEDAITSGDAAVLLEQAEPGLYTASVGNLLPGETATIRFCYGLLLRWNADRVPFAIPTTVAPRFGDPGLAGLAPHQVPEHAFDAETSFRLSVEVHGLLKDARFNSPSHIIDVTPKSTKTIVELAGTPAMDRDFVLEARASRLDAAGALFARDLDGWVALASFRPEIPDTSNAQRRSVKIVVDCSGSMAGDLIAQARAALERILDGLRGGDVFEIIAFGSSQRSLFGREATVSDTTVAQARRFVRALDADMGGTEIWAALDAAYAVRSASNSPRDILLITDGGIWNSNEVITAAKRSGHRIFSVGVGNAVTEAFVRELAEATSGASELVTPREDMAERIHRHFQRMYAPRAKSAFVRWPAEALRGMPEIIETVYGGDTVHVFAWFAEKPEGSASLNVTLTDGRVVSHEARILPFEEGVRTTPPSDDSSPSVLARLAAARCLAAMEDDSVGKELAVRYQLMSEWTNYLVVHVRTGAEKAEELPKISKVPQVLAAGWHGMGIVLREETVSGPAWFETRRASAFKCREAIDPIDLVGRLNAQAMVPFPILDNLEAWGIPAAILGILRELVDQGAAEPAVVAAFLFLLAESEAGSILERQVRRRILKAYKAGKPPQAVVETVTDAFDGWQERSAQGGGG